MDGEGVSEAAAGRFLRDHLGPDVVGVALVGEGAWSRCFGFVRGDQDLVVRFGAHAEDFGKDRRAASFASDRLPVPAVLEVGAALGGHFAISSRVRGEPIELLDPPGWQATLGSLLETLDALRAIDTDATTGWGLWQPDGHAPHRTWREFLLSTAVDDPQRRTAGWRAKLSASAVGDDVFDLALPLLADLAEAAPAERSVVHGDLVNRNVLAVGGRITGVFDWGCSLYGDFLYELALLAFWSPWLDSLGSSDIVADLQRHLAAGGLEVPDFAARLRCCMIHVGLDHHAACVTIGDEASLVRINAQTRALIAG